MHTPSLVAPGPAPMHFAPTALPGVTSLHASVAAHRFDRHVHDTYSFGVTLQGVQAFSCRGTRHANTPGRVIAFNPDEAHDGQPGTARGFSYRMVYVEPWVLQEATRQRALPCFKTASFQDDRIARQFLRAADAAAQPQETLRTESLLQEFLLGVTERHGSVAVTGQGPGCDMRAGRMRDFLRENSARDVSTAELAGVAGTSRVHANRLFNQAFGIAPHAYLNAQRVLQAQRLIARGEPLAATAQAAGFSDQAHLNRRFLASVGVSPGRYQRAVRP